MWRLWVPQEQDLSPAQCPVEWLNEQVNEGCDEFATLEWKDALCHADQRLDLLMSLQDPMKICSTVKTNMVKDGVLRSVPASALPTLNFPVPIPVRTLPRVHRQSTHMLQSEWTFNISLSFSLLPTIIESWWSHTPKFLSLDCNR